MCESVLLCDSTCGNGVDTGPGGDWERRMQNGIGTLSHMVQKYGLEDTLLKEWEWKKTNDPHLDVSPYTLEDDLYRISLMTVEGYVGAAHAILTRPDLTDRVPSITAPTLVMIGEWDDFLPCALRDREAHPRLPPRRPRALRPRLKLARRDVRLRDQRLPGSGRGRPARRRRSARLGNDEPPLTE